MNLGFLGSKTFKVAVTMGMVAVLATVIEWEDLFVLFGQVNWLLLIPLYLLYGSSRIVEALQLKAIISSFERVTSVSRVFLANALATFYGFLLPGELLATIPKWLLLAKDTGSRSDILNAIVYNRIALIIPPLVIGCVALAIIDPFETRATVFLVGAFSIGLIMATFLVFYKKTGCYFLKAMSWLAAKCPAKIHGTLDTLITSFARIHELRVRDHLATYALSILVASIRIVAIIFAARLIHIDVPAHILAVVYSLIVVLGLFPLTLGNIGVREGVIIFVLQLFGTPPTQSILLGLIMFGDMVIFAVVGGFYQVALSQRLVVVKEP